MEMSQDLQAQFQAFLAQNAAAEGGPYTPPPASNGITVNIGGQQISFKDEAELSAALEKTLQAEAQKTAEAAARAQAYETSLKTRPTGTPASPEDEIAKFNARYFTDIEKDAVKASEAAMSRAIFGQEVPNAGAIIRDLLAKSEKNSQILEFYQFKDRNPGFDVSKDGPALDKIRQGLGLPTTADGLDAAYAFAVKNGQLTAAQKADLAAAPNPTVQPPALQGRFQPNPTTPEQSGFDPVTMQAIEDMSLEQLMKFNASQGLLPR